MIRWLIFLFAVSWASGFLLEGIVKDALDCDHYEHDDDHCPGYTHLSQVCGSDGVTYKDFCALMKVRCASKHSHLHMAEPYPCHHSATANVTSMPDATTKTMPTSTAMPQTKVPKTTIVTSTPKPVTSTVAPVTSTVAPLTSTVAPVTSTNGVSVENVLDFLCIELSREDCVPELNEVCGSDGFTYRNYCEFQKARCMHRKLKMDHSGSC